MRRKENSKDQAHFPWALVRQKIEPLPLLIISVYLAFGAFPNVSGGDQRCKLCFLAWGSERRYRPRWLSGGGVRIPD